MENFDFEAANARLTKRLQLFADASEMLAALLPIETARVLRDDAERYIVEAAMSCANDARNFEPACAAVEHATLTLYETVEERRATITAQLNATPTKVSP